MTYTTSGIVESVTITGKAAAGIPDVRGRAMAYDDSGKIIIASDPAKPLAGVGLLTAGASNAGDLDGSVKAGQDVDIQIAAMGYALTGADVKAGDPLTTNADGRLVPAQAGNYVIATAMEAAAANTMTFIQLSKYHL